MILCGRTGRILAIFLLFVSFVFLFFQYGVSEPDAVKPCVEGKSGIFSCNGVTLLAHVPLERFQSKPQSASNIWGYVDLDDHREYAIIGISNGTAVVEVTKPSAPRIVGIVPALSSFWREMKVYSFQNPETGKWDAYAYVTTEARQGLQVLDLSELPKKVSLARIDREISTSHTAFVSNVDFATGVAGPGLTPHLYVEGADNFFFSKVREFPRDKEKKGCGNRACGKKFPGAHCTCGTFCSCMPPVQPNRGFHVYSLSNPRDPEIIGTYSDTYMHDVYVETFTGERARQCAPGHDPCEVVFGWTGQDFRILDFTNKKAPKVLSTLVYENLGFPHSGWISRNKLWLFNFDEFDEVRSGINTRILSIKISDLRNPQIMARWDGPGTSIEHNGYVVGDKLYISSYTRGLLIMNAKNPTALKEIAFFDTYPEDDVPKFAGAWGVYPYLPSGTILISDIDRGLFILKEQEK